ncbi:tetratricopeptide repeat protein [uncultured Erythrobacter sp.]|uniref:tetratricopeptide repeat protein n=1 Tax=uncultured Erythrobacter sp. TaxID=263913 RepID=UPI0026394AC3|nr:tetratricopeptide repeat protein [uncultured Erythrobacter sp.]
MALNPTDPNNTDQDKKPKPETSAEDEVLMREIDEAVRKDDVEQFAQKYGVLLGGGLAIALVAFGGYLFWDNQTEAALEAESEALVSALDSTQAQDFAAATEKVSPLIDSDTPGARTSARLLQAGAALEEEKFDEAVALFKQVADDAEAPPALRDLARIREVATNFDDREPAEIIERLKDLAVPGNAFFGSAGELTAIAHLEAGNRDQAGTLFAEIAKDESVPETLRSRARQMAGLLGVDAIEDVEQLLEDEGVASPSGESAGAAVGTVGAQ